MMINYDDMIQKRAGEKEEQAKLYYARWIGKSATQSYMYNNKLHPAFWIHFLHI